MCIHRPEAPLAVFQYERNLFEEVTKIIFSIIHDYYLETAPTAVKTGVVVSYQSFEDLMSCNPHYNFLVLEGGIDFISHSSCLFAHPLSVMLDQVRIEMCIITLNI